MYTKMKCDNYRAISRSQDNGTDTGFFSSEFLPIGLTSLSSSSELKQANTNDSLLPILMTANNEKSTATTMLTFTYIIFFLQHLCNPLIYIVSNRAYRTAYYKILCRQPHHGAHEGVTTYRFSQTGPREGFEMNQQYA